MRKELYKKMKNYKSFIISVKISKEKNISFYIPQIYQEEKEVKETDK